MFGCDRSERERALEVEWSREMMYVKAVVVNFALLSNKWVDVWGEHSGVKGRVILSTDGEGAFIGVR